MATEISGKFPVEDNPSVTPAAPSSPGTPTPTPTPTTTPSNSVGNVQAITDILQKEVAKVGESNACVPHYVKALIDAYRFDVSAWQEFAHYDKTRYQRVLLSRTAHCSVLLLCWEGGQSTPKHVHERGGHHTWVKVLSGRLVHSIYSGKACPGNDCAVQMESTLDPASSTFYMAASAGLHRLENASDSAPALSLHVYSPPYVECTFDQDQRFAVERPRLLPVVFHPVPACPIKSPGPDSAAPQSSASLISGESSRFSTLDGLVANLRRDLRCQKAADRPAELIEQVLLGLRSTRFNETEWRSYCHVDASHYTRNLVGYDDVFTVLLLVWDRNQVSPIHDHAEASCWMKVLCGEMVERRYVVDDAGGLAESAVTRMGAEDAEYIDDSRGVHAFGNESDEVAVSLHVYSPPYHRCHIFEPSTGKAELVTVGKAYSVENPFTELALRRTFSVERIGADVSPMPHSPAPLLPQVDSVSALTRALKEACSASGIDATRACELLGAARISEHEWRQYVHFSEARYQRVLLAFDENFSIVLNCWTGSQATPVHSHGADRMAWMRVLTGRMRMTTYESDDAAQGQFLSTLEMHPTDGVYFLDPLRLGSHVLRNDAPDVEAVTLHLYSPPYVELTHGPGGHRVPVIFSSDAAAAAARKGSAVVQAAAAVFGDMGDFLDSVAHVTEECTVPIKRLCMRDSPEDKAVVCRSHEKLIQAVAAFCFHPEELRSYLADLWRDDDGANRAVRRCAVACARDFSVSLAQYPAGVVENVCPCARYHAICVRVLSGTLSVSVEPSPSSGGIVPISSSRRPACVRLLPMGKVCIFCTDDRVQSFENRDTQTCIVLEIRFPPMMSINRCCCTSSQCT